MKLALIICSALLVATCNHTNTTSQTAENADTSAKAQTPKDSSYIAENWQGPADSGQAVEEDPEYANYFIVIADTAAGYYPLRSKMVSLDQGLHFGIDTMGRFYHADKKKIALADNDEDEMYAGEYYPRRYPSGGFSLEYLNFYKDDSKDDMIALVGGIYETRRSADSVANILKKKEKKAFVQEAKVYVGCMH